jgi:hypothetical protein
MADLTPAEVLRVLASYEDRLSAIETRLTELTWAVGAMAMLMLVIGGPMFWLLVRVAGKVGV